MRLVRPSAFQPHVSPRRRGKPAAVAPTIRVRFGSGAEVRRGGGALVWMVAARRSSGFVGAGVVMDRCQLIICAGLFKAQQANERYRRIAPAQCSSAVSKAKP